MKAKLTFDLDDAEDRRAHLRCVKSLELVLIIYDINQELRSRTKYAPDSTSEDELKALYSVRDFIFQKLSEYNVDLDEMII